jgi:hypothetical protein
LKDESEHGVPQVAALLLKLIRKSDDVVYTAGLYDPKVQAAFDAARAPDPGAGRAGPGKRRIRRWIGAGLALAAAVLLFLLLR